MHPQKVDRIMTVIILLSSAVVGIAVISLLAFIITAGLPHLSWDFIASASSAFTSGGGIRDQLFNSFYLVILTMLISLPLSLGGAIYLSEYAKPSKLTDGFRLAIEVLGSLPSIVVGLFGYLVLVLKFHLDFSLLAGAIALTIINLPLLTRSCETALSQVPSLQRQAGLGLGMSKWKVTTKIVMPAALPGIVTGAILSVGRIFGEAAALIYTSGQSSMVISYTNWNPFSHTSFLNPMRPAETLAVHIWKLNTEGLVPDATAVSAGAATVLILTILLFNLLARFVGYLIKRRMTK
ncbi:phosphate ABC transporter permease PstA [Limosilactobacillus equigenerosi]|uniref:Phosphate transport system permease protein PstA n=2 Tax=Limosilactobacillus TaxID=2742598 RepID=A0A0R1UT35_9LACO|nr:phosphate ABC transporter permease PstA [Limosilactobacillus equigenerosi]KRL96352.1 phosphate ABC transporter, permease protein PstA [Limosilactobacillus equigenerosi DSM 18793 = JCM 14505]